MTRAYARDYGYDRDGRPYVEVQFCPECGYNTWLVLSGRRLTCEDCGYRPKELLKPKVAQ